MTSITFTCIGYRPLVSMDGMAEARRAQMLGLGGGIEEGLPGGEIA